MRMCSPRWIELSLRCAVAPAALVMAAGLVVGCAGGGGQGRAETLDAGDFRAPGAPSAAGVAGNGAHARNGGMDAQPMNGAAAAGDTGRAGPIEGTRPGPRRPIKMSASTEASDGVLDVTTLAGPPRVQESRPAGAGVGVTLDAKVGEINGRPIFASSFLEPLEGRLRAIAREAGGNTQRWNVEASKVIADALREQVHNELILAEAYASLSKAERDVGIRGFLAMLRQDIARRNEGSVELADERLREEEGRTLDEKMKDQLQRELIYTEVRRRILPRVNVSSRDQREFYEQNFALFNPPGKAVLRVILVPAENAEAVESVRAALAEGTPFAEAARLPANGFLPETGGEHVVNIDGAYEEAMLLSIPELNAAAQALDEGETIGPIPTRNSLAWVHLERIDRAPGVEFYDAQLDIGHQLMSFRLRLEEARYFERLRSRGSFSNLVSTGERLMEIATERYFLAAP